MDFKRALKIARIRAGCMSIRDLCKRTGVSPSTIIRIEAGNPPNIETIEKLAEALGMKASDLIAMAEEEAARDETDTIRK